jgi:preprotein translocase subunit YajC
MSWFIIAATATPSGTPGGSFLNSGFLMMILLLVVFWVVLIMPQRKQQKQRDTMLKSLKKGDKVVTIGGLYGEIIEMDDDDVKLRVADKVEMKFTRGAISKVKS